METLATILHILVYVVAILGLLVVIYILVGGLVNMIFSKKRQEKARNEAIKGLNEVVDILAKLDKEEEKPKKKATKKAEKTKEN